MRPSIATARSSSASPRSRQSPPPRARPVLEAGTAGDHLPRSAPLGRGGCPSHGFRDRPVEPGLSRLILDSKHAGYLQALCGRLLRIDGPTVMPMRRDRFRRCISGISAGHTRIAVTDSGRLGFVRTCQHCDERLSSLRRADARFCSTRCRVASHRAGTDPILPTALTNRARWVRWSPTKVPLAVSGGPASVSDPSTWSTFDEVVRSRRGVGIGFVLGDGIVGIDLDHCLVEGRLAPWAETVLAGLPATYVEVSPSGDGLHVLGRSSFTGGRRFTVGDGRVEVYGSGRYFTVSRVPWVRSSRRLANLDRFLEGILQ